MSSLHRLGSIVRRAFGRALPRRDGCGIDIVVPVCDAHADVERCLMSVLRHGAGDFRLVVVVDAIADSALVGRLDSLAARDPRVILLRNAANAGFVKSANRGMLHDPRREVLLLNSDAEVPGGFLERLRAAGQHTARTGIVSPFTSDGTILSLPQFMAASPLPAGLDVAGFDALIAGTSAQLRPEIVTAHGFCMLIRREVLDAVGAFDEVFGRGGGEDKDLCERARAAGFEVRLCDDLFVCHAGGASIATETDALSKGNLEVLGRHHPRHHDDVRRFICANPLAAAHANVHYQLSRRTRRRAPALLMVLHADPFANPRREPVGGTQMHVLDLVAALALPRVVVTWPRGTSLHAAEVSGGDIARPVRHRFPAALGDGGQAPHDRFALADEGRERAFDDMVNLFDVGAVHLHHLSGWPARIWRTLAAREIPFAYTVHDYLCTCPAFYRLDLGTLTPCACSDGAAADARRCLEHFFQACGLPRPADALERIRAQRAEFGALLAAAVVVIAPSESARGVVAQAFPAGRFRWEVIPHALPVVPASTPPRAPDGILRVALIGAPSAPWKGADATLAVMRATRAMHIEWHVFGDAGVEGFPDRAAEAVGALANERLHMHGGYTRDDLPALLAGAAIDVSLMLSPWPETFSYTLSESWAAGVPAIVRDLGAPAERVRVTGAGLVVADDDEAAAALRRLAQEPTTRRALAEVAAAAARGEPSPAENAARYRAAYGRMLDRLAVRPVDPPFGFADRALFAAHAAAMGD